MGRACTCRRKDQLTRSALADLSCGKREFIFWNRSRNHAVKLCRRSIPAAPKNNRDNEPKIYRRYAIYCIRRKFYLIFIGKSSGQYGEKGSLYWLLPKRWIMDGSNTPGNRYQFFKPRRLSHGYSRRQTAFLFIMEGKKIRSVLDKGGIYRRS